MDGYVLLIYAVKDNESNDDDCETDNTNDNINCRKKLYLFNDEYNKDI